MEFLAIERESAPKASTIEQYLDAQTLGFPVLSYVALTICICALDASASRLDSLVARNCALQEFSPAAADTVWSQTALFAMLSSVGRLLGLLIALLVADRMGRRPLALLGIGVASFFAIASAFSWSWTSFLVIRAVVDVGTACAILPALHITAEILPTKDRSRVLSVVAVASFAVGPLLTDVLAAVVLGTFGWRKLLLIIGVASVCVFVIAYYSLFESPRFLLGVGKTTEAEIVVQKLIASSIKPDLSLSTAYEGGSMTDLFGPSLWQSTRGLLLIYAGTGFCLSAQLRLLNQSDEMVGSHSCTFTQGIALILTSAFALTVTFAVATLMPDHASRRNNTSAKLFAAAAVCQGALLVESTFQGPLLILSTGFALSAFGLIWAHTAEVIYTDVRTRGHCLFQMLFVVGQAASTFWTEDEASLSFTLAAIAMLTLVSPETQGTLDSRLRSLKNRSLDEHEEELHGLLFR